MTKISQCPICNSDAEIRIYKEGKTWEICCSKSKYLHPTVRYSKKDIAIRIWNAKAEYVNKAMKEWIEGKE